MSRYVFDPEELQEAADLGRGQPDEPQMGSHL